MSELREKCSMVSCVNPRMSHGLCTTHRRRQILGQDLSAPVRVCEKVTPVIFWSRVDKNSGYGPTGDCWIWLGTLNHGYGTVRFDGKQQMAHRVAYFLTHGRYPQNNALHGCDNPPCCNPAHLRDGTQADNMQDMWKRGRATRFKLTLEQVKEIRARIAAGEIPHRLRTDYNVSDVAIYYVRDARTWGGVTL